MLAVDFLSDSYPDIQTILVGCNRTAKIVAVRAQWVVRLVETQFVHSGFAHRDVKVTTSTIGLNS